MMVKFYRIKNKKLIKQKRIIKTKERNKTKLTKINNY